ncbi:TyeA family type III secretion system gatekeeper subunit [Paraburkholderia hayleyella]|uniref:TyeA family type III secretion system gatekeeper subunit n=1 Tax=Paraburkholderia hayleyella TaxID=2152889 RepID=UPI001291FACC|nr:TyeA family type III secretion system gatekeeper subunit [Paraburkholderia hayleyella]
MEYNSDDDDPRLELMLEELLRHVSSAQVTAVHFEDLATRLGITDLERRSAFLSALVTLVKSIPPSAFTDKQRSSNILAILTASTRAADLADSVEEGAPEPVLIKPPVTGHSRTVLGAAAPAAGRKPHGT